jgi:hypothetical protein
MSILLYIIIGVAAFAAGSCICAPLLTDHEACRPPMDCPDCGSHDVGIINDSWACRDCEATNICKPNTSKRRKN